MLCLVTFENFSKVSFYMSRIGKLPVEIPENVKLTIENNLVKVEGPRGTLEYTLPAALKVEKDEHQVRIMALPDYPEAKALWGLWRSLIYNAVSGVSVGFTKDLELVGLGFKAQKVSEELELSLGFSHTVRFSNPAGITFAIEKNVIKVQGFDKQLVGETAARIRKLRPPEPYKGKGIRYVGEVVRRKAGKATKVATATK